MRPPWGVPLLIALLAAAARLDAADVGGVPPDASPPEPGPNEAPAATFAAPRGNPAEPGMEPEGHARLTVTGLGWLENLTMKGLLRSVRPRREASPVYDANFVEDSAFLLANHALRLGFLEARIRARLRLADGSTLEVTWQDAESPVLPRPLAAREVAFEIEPGPRYVYDDLRFVGLDPAAAEAARGFFIRRDGLLLTRRMRRFSPSELEEAVANLRGSLRDEGFARAEVAVESVDLDHTRGAARVVVRVNRGERHRLHELAVTVRDTADGPVLERSTRAVDRLLKRTTGEDLAQAILEDTFREGYPDATTRVSELRAEPGPDGVSVDLRVEVIRGPRIRLGTVRFESPVVLRRPRVLENRTRMEGPWLDRLEVDAARSRLAGLGAFRFVRVRYDTADGEPEVRDPVFELEPRKLLTVDVLAGYRSYDLLYGGLEVRRKNLFGVGHAAELRLVQSFRSSEGNLTYSIPDVLVEDLTLYATADLLIRDEVSFRREELRSGAGLRRAFEATGQQAGIRYLYEVLRANDAPPDAPGVAGTSAQQNVAALSLDWSVDRRDSALNPRQGYRVAATLEAARPEFGGDSRYLRPDVAASVHIRLGGGRFLNLGAQYSLVADPEGEGKVPFNKRLFPGGEDSVRGYQRGEAGPLNDHGEVIGAETALVWNLELEQLLTTSWSVVGFADGVAEAASIDQFPADEVLWSVGGGIRWNSIVGPVRLEYGHNLNRRRGDPSGTLHFSVGFPF